MPEGHTLHRLAGELNHSFAERRVRVTSPQGRFAASAAELDDTVLITSSAHGKQLFCDFDSDRILHIHLGLIGSLDVGPPTAVRGEVRVRIATEHAVADLRGPQLCVVRTPEEVAAVVATLGPDPLRADADPELAWSRLHRSGRPIAALLNEH